MCYTHMQQFLFKSSIHPDQIADAQIRFSSSPNENITMEIIRELFMYGISIAEIEDPL